MATINQQPTTDFLIVGAGLAGLLLAWRLEQAGQSVQLIGDCQAPSAAAVAAGVINPVTGRWSVKSWNFDQLSAEAQRCYQTIEQQFGIRIYHPIPLKRYCHNDEDVKRIRRRMRNPRYSDVLGDYHAIGTGPAEIADTHGSFDIVGAAYVDLPRLLDALRQHFTAQGRLEDAPFLHRELTKTDNNTWTYHKQHARHVIFCEGANLPQNPWFNDLPLTPIKGETLIVECPDLELPKAIYHHQKWFLPYDDGTIRIGATYDIDNLEPTPTESGKQSLLDGFYEAIDRSHTVNIRQHLAGLRPSTADVRPFLGTHPEHPTLHILNGLGSKGASVAPEMSRLLVNYLLHNEPIDEEINIARFQ